MLTEIDEVAFREGHQAFLSFVARKAGGNPFVNFEHPYFVSREVAYKYAALAAGRRVLALDKWNKWKPGAGRILEATKAACAPSVSANLLEHRYGERGDSASPLYRVKAENAIADLESELRSFLLGGDDRPDSFGRRFDRFAQYLRDRSLGCKWPFLAYLAFLLNHTRYFPILPGRFGALLRYYGVTTDLAGRVEWARYQAVLRLAEILKEKLALYGLPTVIHVQSYMWVVGGLVSNGAVRPMPNGVEIDFASELAARQARAAERERVGLLGEQYVADRECQRLRDGGRADLAVRVRLVSLESNAEGYDVLSFHDSGQERHLEVKTTSVDENSDQGFWLSERERERAASDPQWCIVRVWLTSSSATCRDLGNVVRDVSHEWSLQPDTWFVCRNSA